MAAPASRRRLIVLGQILAEFMHVRGRVAGGADRLAALRHSSGAMAALPDAQDNGHEIVTRVGRNAARKEVDV